MALVYLVVLSQLPGKSKLSTKKDTYGFEATMAQPAAQPDPAQPCGLSRLPSACLFTGKRRTVDGRNPAPPQKPWNDDSSANTNNQGFPMVSKWCERISQPSTVWILGKRLTRSHWLAGVRQGNEGMNLGNQQAAYWQACSFWVQRKQCI